MARLNHHFTKLSPLSLFATIERQKKEYLLHHPNGAILDLTVEQPFFEYTLQDHPSDPREAIASHEYSHLNITADEIFLNYSSAEEIGSVQEIFAIENRIALPNPSSPIYIDTNVMAGRTRLPLKTGGYGGVIYLPCTEENSFMPQVPNRPADLIYLSSPNHATGVAMDRKSLEAMVQYAKESGAVILFDATYAPFIRTPDTPRSIYEIPGAKELAIEVRSGFTVVPFALKITESYQTLSVHALWQRRQQTRSERFPHSTLKRKEAKQIEEIVLEHLNKAALLRNGLMQLGYTVYGGMDSPFVWMKAHLSDTLLKEQQILAVPGVGFGTEGEGYLRLSCFAEEKTIKDALKRFA